jgi:pimeloyl-ACP methyl ester carboxylesterase
MKTTGCLTTSDQQKIYYDRYNGGHEKVIIIAHGFFASKQSVLFMQLAKELSNEFDVIIFDFRGHGLSQGLFYWTSSEYMDLLAVVEFAKKSYAKIGVIGFSLGAASSIIAASKTPHIDSIIAVSAPLELGKIEYKFWQLDVQNELFYNVFGQGRHGKGVRPGPFWLNKEKPIDVVKTIQTPIFYIHGDRDWVIGHHHSQELYKHTLSVKRLNIMKNGPHAENLFKEYPAELLTLCRSWFHETLM